MLPNLSFSKQIIQLLLCINGEEMQENKSLYMETNQPLI